MKKEKEMKPRYTTIKVLVGTIITLGTLLCMLGIWGGATLHKKICQDGYSACMLVVALGEKAKLHDVSVKAGKEEVLTDSFMYQAAKGEVKP